MKDKIQIISSLRSRLLEDRFFHSLNVADMAKELALIYGADPEQAYLAGLVHDCTKNTPAQVQLQIMEQGGMVLTDLERQSPKLWHAMSGSLFIQSEYGIEDAAVISAVRYHTTGKAAMSLLEKIIYIADYTSAERDYPGVEQMRHWAHTDLDKAVFEGAAFTVKKLQKAGLPVHPDTLAAKDYYQSSECGMRNAEL
ncbi:MAG: HD domain-containing protein [Ruminococcaceae bacterium]|nr:HD domain-containing protein [Oscillospiraceae bacterium]